MPFSDQRPVVWATGVGRIPICKRCHLPQPECQCQGVPAKHSAAQTAHDGFVRLARDRKNRGGKTVTLISNIPGNAAALTEMTHLLKKLCGSGGTCKDLTITIQGDHRDRIEVWLLEQGYKVKRVGG